MFKNLQSDDDYSHKSAYTDLGIDNTSPLFTWYWIDTNICSTACNLSNISNISYESVFGYIGYIAFNAGKILTDIKNVFVKRDLIEGSKNRNRYNITAPIRYFNNF